MRPMYFKHMNNPEKTKIYVFGLFHIENDEDYIKENQKKIWYNYWRINWNYEEKNRGAKSWNTTCVAAFQKDSKSVWAQIQYLKTLNLSARVKSTLTSKLIRSTRSSMLHIRGDYANKKLHKAIFDRI